MRESDFLKIRIFGLKTMHDWTLLIPFGALIAIMGGLTHGIYFAFRRSKQNGITDDK
jgi:hypothetical protein